RPYSAVRWWLYLQPDMVVGSEMEAVVVAVFCVRQGAVAQLSKEDGLHAGGIVVGFQLAIGVGWPQCPCQQRVVAVVPAADGDVVGPGQQEQVVECDPALASRGPDDLCTLSGAVVVGDFVNGISHGLEAPQLRLSGEVEAD